MQKSKVIKETLYWMKLLNLSTYKIICSFFTKLFLDSAKQNYLRSFYIKIRPSPSCWDEDFTLEKVFKLPFTSHIYWKCHVRFTTPLIKVILMTTLIHQTFQFWLPHWLTCTMVKVLPPMPCSFTDRTHNVISLGQGFLLPFYIEVGSRLWLRSDSQNKNRRIYLS